MEKSPNEFDDVDFNTLNENQVTGVKPCIEAWPYRDDNVTMEILLRLCKEPEDWLSSYALCPK